MGKARTTNNAAKCLRTVELVVANTFVLGQNPLAASNFFFLREVLLPLGSLIPVKHDCGLLYLPNTLIVSSL
jgi:hypothetical protein